MKIAFMRHTAPRVNTLGYPTEKLGKNGFQVPLRGKNITLPDGTLVEDGAIFHRNFITDPANRKYIEQANIQAFIPCGGFKDTINRSNVKAFTGLFRQLRFIVEGANVFFDDAARRYIASSTDIKQIKDSSANKGGVFSSAVAEVLTAFLFEEEYEASLLEDKVTRWALIRDIIDLVAKYAALETKMLIRIHEANPSEPLFALSEKTSEQIFGLPGLCPDPSGRCYRRYRPFVGGDAILRARYSGQTSGPGADTCDYESGETGRIPGCHYYQKTGRFGLLQARHGLGGLC